MSDNPYAQFVNNKPDANNGNPYASIADEHKMTWGDAALSAIKNIPSSAGNFATGLYQAVRHPIQTVSGMADVGRGAGQELAGAIKGGKAPDTQQTEAFDAVKKYFGDRYGSMEGFKKAIANDPVGVMADLSTVVGGGELAMAKAGRMGADIAKIAGTVSDATNPANIAGKIFKGAVAANNLIKNPAGKAASHLVGLTTGVGSRPFELAYQAGRVGGPSAQKFLNNMRGNAPVTQVIDSAKDAVSQLRAERNANYRSGMYDISKDKSVLDFKPIDVAFVKAASIKNYKGKDISPSTAQIRDRLRAAINDWKSSDPTEYHTPEGMDAFKQLIGDIRSDTKPGSPERVMANSVYHSIKDEITQQAPTYAKVMKDYETASDLLGEMQDTFSLKDNAKTDTTLRKLQSIMRDNVQTNYGRRTELAEILGSKAPGLEQELAGQSLSSLAPRGVARIPAGAEAYMGLTNPMALLGLVPASPRLMGETAYGLGAARRTASNPVVSKAANIAKKSAPAAYQAGQAKRVMDQLQGNYQ